MAHEGRFPAFLAAAAVTAADQLTKLAARDALLMGIPREVLGNAVRFTLRYNYGAAFSLGWGGPLFLTLFTLIACILLVRYMLRSGSRKMIVKLGLILGGAVGNLIDRIAMGKVTDFIDVGLPGLRWPTFNVADIAICIGGFAVFLLYRKSRRSTVRWEEKE